MYKDENGLPVGAPLTNWQGATLPGDKSLMGQYCEVQVARNSQCCAELYDAFSQDTVGSNWAYLPYGPFNTLSAFSAWFEQTCLSADPLFHTIKDKQSGRLVGLASFLRINPLAGSIEVGHIHFSPLMQRTPIATEAMFLMMSTVFEDLGYRRYEWKCDALNGPSNNAAKRLGFQFEGIFRQATVYKSRNRDTAWYSVIDGEWPTLKKAFLQWLDPNNIDSSGQQKQSLASFRN